MRIDYTYFSHAIPLLRDKIVLQLTDQQKKVLAVASIVFAFIAFFCLGYCFKKRELDNSDDAQLDGFATVKFLDGTVLEGEFKNGKLNGEGKKVLPDGGSESGQYKDGKLYQGDKFDKSADTLTRGEFDETGQLLKGKAYLSDSSCYEGEFKNGKLHGKGKVTYPDGTVKIGNFVNGIFQDMR